MMCVLYNYYVRYFIENRLMQATGRHWTHPYDHIYSYNVISIYCGLK